MRGERERERVGRLVDKGGYITEGSAPSSITITVIQRFCRHLPCRATTAFLCVSWYGGKHGFMERQATEIVQILYKVIWSIDIICLTVILRQ